MPPVRLPETRRNPYSRVLEGQHLSMRLAPSSGRVRKSPPNHRVVGEYIRNPALRLLPLELSTFPQAIVKKEKESKRKKTAAAVPFTLSKHFRGRTIRGIPPIPTNLFTAKPGGRDVAGTKRAHIVDNVRDAGVY
jgi:hypothetical protein